MRYILWLALIIFSFCTVSFAQDYPSGASAFIEKVNNACKKADANSFQSLYCTTSAEKSRLDLPDIFTRSGKIFSSANLKKASSIDLEGYGEYILLICCCRNMPLNSEVAREECEIFKITEKDDQVCIDEKIKIKK